MVTPPALIAATPVGAKTTMLFFEVFTKFRKKVVFPVPAFPVIKTERFVRSIRLKANSVSLKLMDGKIQKSVLN